MSVGGNEETVAEAESDASGRNWRSNWRGERAGSCFGGVAGRRTTQSYQSGAGAGAAKEGIEVSNDEEGAHTRVQSHKHGNGRETRGTERDA